MRAIEYENFVCGDGRTSFVHVTVRLLAGRSDEMKETLAVSLRTALSELLPRVESISIDSVVRAKAIARTPDGRALLAQVVGSRRTVVELSAAEVCESTDLVLISVNGYQP